MKTITAQREKIAALAKSANHLLAEKGDQTWSKEEQATFDGYTNEIDLTKGQIKAAEKMREIDADSFFNAAPAKKEDEHTIDAMSAVALYLRNGANVTHEQALAIRNAMSTTTAAEGGFTVPAEIATMVVEKMKAFGGMRDVATAMSTAGGNSMNWPTSDGTAEVGAIVGQNTVVNSADVTFGTISLNPFYYTSNQIALPLELIQDSAIDVVGFVVARLATRIARIQNTHFTVGAGTTLPDGVIPRAGVGKVGVSGQTLTATYDDLIDLIHSVNRAYRGAGRFMMNDFSLAVVRKLKDTTGRPIWNPGDMEGIAEGVPSTLCGYAYTINDDVPVMAANAKSIAFGDFSQYMIRDVAGTTTLRRFDDSNFALKNQVGFCGWTRSGGNLMEPAAVKVYTNSST
ncbi:phage major capsid protein [Actimicrobium sp. CCC2.4]|jgi:HK97 family phage major capsid protein|uniref:phage major capsid protein n=1 Tax=Actimicrobium sp. CCC2.4 TaxID=3048606 RepID=UPI002AC93ED6|nr:phage major capsid protein [Actimicrobium sp. CCC2.4]MEB0133787.1 phage major capsid protein [Actimicrobium sp. CCC2.4]WPX31330.1 phage major capsid protein [Actimicrobium sp. CCC2.4]